MNIIFRQFHLDILKFLLNRNQKGFVRTCVKKLQHYSMKTNFSYPIARKDETVDDYHGIKIRDPYRWLENPISLETQKFVEEQNEVTKPFLQGCPEWKQINEKLTKLWNYPKYGCPEKHGEHYYYFHNTGLQNQSVLYKQSSLNAEPQVVLDPNALAEDGTIALAQKSFSEDGNLLAYGLAESGSDWTKIFVRSIATGKDFGEVLEKVKFSEISWTKDNKCFFYARYPDHLGKTDGSETQNNENQKLFYHRVGEPQQKDVLVAEFPEEPNWRIEPKVSDCGNYLFMQIVKDCRDNILYYADLKECGNITGKLKIHKIIENFEADFEYITNVGTKVFLRSNKNAPNYRIIKIDLLDVAEKNWGILVPEHECKVLDMVKCVDEDKMLLCYIQDVKSVLQVNSLVSGEVIRTFDLDIGTIVSLSGDKKSSEIFYNFVSFLNPGSIYHFDFQKPDKEPIIYRQTEINLDGFDEKDYKVDQMFYSSKDGTRIPMFTIRKRTETLEPKPCLLYGYGGFNISVQPSFSVTGLTFINLFDGILAYPNIRGGGEYGEKWHNSGRLLNKQNVFDDFQAAAEFLIRNKLTTKNLLAIQGGSNGGLLVAACINQRPDLFGAAVAQVGVMDMLRFHKFTIGRAWCSDYGNPDEQTHFENLMKYSPLHNVRTPTKSSEEYPSTLILTADHDDRVSPLHSLKYVAALQEAVRKSDIQKYPVLLRVYTKAGHGAGKPITKRIEEGTDILTFLFKIFKISNL